MVFRLLYLIMVQVFGWLAWLSQRRRQDRGVVGPTALARLNIRRRDRLGGHPSRVRACSLSGTDGMIGKHNVVKPIEGSCRRRSIVDSGNTIETPAQSAAVW
jgi:hypothetical protein